MKARIRPGAAVTMDMQVWTWPNLPHAEVDMVFEATPFAEGYELRRDWFGLHRPNNYGNGAIYAMAKDVESVPVAGECHICAVPCDGHYGFRIDDTGWFSLCSKHATELGMRLLS